MFPALSRPNVPAFLKSSFCLAEGVTAAPKIRPPYWFGGRSWYGQQEFNALFSRETTRPPGTPTFTCTPSILVTSNVTLHFGPSSSQLLNASMPANQSFAGDSVNAQAFQGTLAYELLSRIDDPVDVEIEEMIFFALTETLEFGQLPLRSASTVFAKVGYLGHPGNFGTMRFVQRFQVSTQGMVTSYLQLNSAAHPACTMPTADTSGSVVSVATLVENSWMWAPHPWQACSASGSVPSPVLTGLGPHSGIPFECRGTRAREVSCIDAYGSLAEEAKCSLPTPTASELCMATECAHALSSSSRNESEAWARQGVQLPPALLGRWTAVFHTFRTGLGGTAGLASASGALVRIVSIEFAHGSMNGSTGAVDSFPNITLVDIDQVFVFDQQFRNATALRASPDDSLTFAGRVNAAGNDTHGVVSANSAISAAAERVEVSTSLALAYLPAGETSLIGPLNLVNSGPGSLALAITPGAPELAAALPLHRQISRANTTTQEVLDILGVTSLRTSVHTGLAVKGRPSFVQRPFGICSFDSSTNTCVRRRPPMACISEAGNAIDSVFCAGQDEPTTDGSSELTCTGCVRYDIGQWSPCSRLCQGGLQSRSVKCQDLRNVTVPMGQCVALLGPAPTSSQVCNNYACASYRTGEWSACSSPCGPGQETRSVVCADIAGPLHESRCVAEALQRPNSTRSCFRCVCEDASLSVAPVVREPSAEDLARLSTSGSFEFETSDSFCPGQSRLLRISEWRCYPKADQDRMCATLNAASGASILPFAFRTELGQVAVPARFVPAPASDSQTCDVDTVRPDTSCFFLPFPNQDTGFVDRTRQGAVGICRQVRVA